MHACVRRVFPVAGTPRLGFGGVALGVGVGVGVGVGAAAGVSGVTAVGVLLSAVFCASEPAGVLVAPWPEPDVAVTGC